jgi:hypothetical protein
MELSVVISIILLIAILGGIFSYHVNQAYQTLGGFVAALCALVLFLIAIRVIHI